MTDPESRMRKATSSQPAGRLVNLDGVTFRHAGAEEPVLRDTSWDIPSGAFELVVGRSGSGKSTLLRCLNGLVPHFSGGAFGGQICVAGHDIRQVGPKELSAVVGFVFQDPETQLVTNRVDHEIAFSLEQHGIDRITMRKRVEGTLGLLGIAHLRDRRPDQLSGGERQRVAIAAALAMQPPILVLDEPTSQLDPWGAEDVLSVLSRLNEDLGLTVVLAEHRLERVLGRVDHVRVMTGAGVTVRDGTPQEVAGWLDPIALPPVTQLGRHLGRDPLPVTVKDGRDLAHVIRLCDPPLSSLPPSPGDLAISASGIRVRLGDRVVLRDASLEARYGECIALMGRNGSGKTTLMRALMGVQRVERGCIEVAGVKVSSGHHRDLGGRIGYLPQQAGSLFFKDRLIDELLFTIKARKATDDTAQLVRRFALDDLVQRHPLDLSGGERERAALATVMAGGPRVVLLDEPTRGMDAWRKAELATLLGELQRDGALIIMATHDVELVARFASRVMMLDEGEIIADGSPRSVLTGSLTFTTQINKIFGGSWLTVRDVYPEYDLE